MPGGSAVQMSHSPQLTSLNPLLSSHFILSHINYEIVPGFLPKHCLFGHRHQTLYYLSLDTAKVA